MCRALILISAKLLRIMAARKRLLLGPGRDDLVARQRTEGAVIEAGDAPHREKHSADIWGRMTSVR